MQTDISVFHGIIPPIYQYRKNVISTELMCEYRTGGSAKAKLAMRVRSLTNLAVGTDRPCMQRMAIALQIA